ncbi:hypothetical protein DSO57_1028424 [Entomophthora muscae]|uniref:Uncharacterized protein n=1 Tax=Entomophthora muscae TaxID=34485 RepID=A0ACC2RSK9_9FUNG|nr:hypothetical protein DSO57_1028424 [Entomophthora muscae]
MVAGSERGTDTHVKGLGPTISSLKLLPPRFQRLPRYFVLVATPKSCPLPTLPSSIDSGYDKERLIGEVNLCLHVTVKDTTGFSLQHVYTITQRNQYVCEVTCIWALEKSANPELTCTLELDLQANAPCCFSLALHLFLQAVKDNNPQLYLPLALSVAHFMWYPPKVCSSGAVGFEGCCLEHFCGLAYQSKVSLPACYSYMEDVLLDCLTLGSAFSACDGGMSSQQE